MERLAFRDKKGVTLIEMLFALLILSIVSLALIRMTLMAMTEIIKTDLRYEAVNVAEQRMNELRGLPFSDAQLNATPASGIQEPEIAKTIRNFQAVYVPTRTVTDINAESKQVTVVVSWNYKGTTCHHGVTSIFMGNQ